MKHYRSLDDITLDNACLTIGTFDGLHRGHQEIVRQLTVGAREAQAPAVVLTFHPPPAVVLGKRQNPQYLTTQEELAALLAGNKVDVLISHPFDQTVAALTAREFLERLKKHLGFRRLWIGYDFAMGRDRQGDVAALRQIGPEMDYQVQVVQAVDLEGEIVSSSRTRALITAGRVSAAAQLLGRPYRLEGVVVRGEGRGRTIGIPTANLSIPPERARPGNGVYVCRAEVAGQTLGAATNVGVRPTFDGQGTQVTVEAHLLGFSGDLYGQSVTLEFIERIRGEQQFPDVKALVSQIRADIEQARLVVIGSQPTGQD